jgi:hypothetical protein
VRMNSFDAGKRLAMPRLPSTGPRASFIVTLWCFLLLPTIAWAGWGDENWGVMTWGGGITPIPSLPPWGRIALLILLAALSSNLLVKRYRRART